MDLYKRIEVMSQDIRLKLIAARRHFHKYPEVGLETRKTADFIGEYLTKLGIEYEKLVDSSAVSALIKGRNPGKTIALRADMDALRVHEENDVPYKSLNPGLMHACGHDFHMASLLGAAEILNDLKNEFSGNVRLIFQPAEETISGALAMLEEGIFENPSVDAAVGLHIWPQIPSGKIGVVKGACFSAVNNFIITIKGKGGHGALPHLAKNPLTAGANIINGLNSIVAGQIDAFSPAILTVCSFNGGSSLNIIPNEAVIKGTIRAFQLEEREDMERRVTDVCGGMAKAWGISVTCEFVHDAPPVINDGSLTPMFTNTAETILGKANVLTLISPSMVSEDFSYFSQLVPSVYFFLGGRNEDMGYVNSLHSPRFNADEESIPVGACLFAAFAIDYLTKK